MSVTKTTLPYYVRRSIARYRREFQAEITRLVVEKLQASGGIINPEDVGECAANVIFGTAEQIAAEDLTPVEAVAMKAYHAGKS